MSRNDEIRDYPLNKINEIRIKDEKRKKALKLFFTVVSFILIFCIGFVSGFYFGAPDKPDVAEVSGSSNSNGKAVANPEMKSDANVPDTKEENQMLEEIKASFINTMSREYPDADFSFAIKNLDTGAYIIHNDKQMNSASVIKLFIMQTIYDEAKKGTYELTADREADLAKMITESNNEATNRFIDDFGGQAATRKITADNTINKTIEAKGYSCTELNRKMHDTTPPEGPTGFENYTSAKDVITLLEGIYNKTVFDEPYNTYALNLLKSQHRRGKIPAAITQKYPDVIVANKTGELSQVENDVALIMCDDFNLAFAVFVNEIPKKADGSTDYNLKEQVQKTISELGLELVEMYKTL